MFRKFLTVIMLLCVAFHVRADVVIPGEIKLQFMFTNLDKFPGYTYYYHHHGYHYNKGWQSENPDTELVENKKVYTVAIKGNDKSYLMALPMVNSDGHYLLSGNQVGGGEHVNPSIRGIVEVYIIVNMDKDAITIKKESEIITYDNGKVEVKKMSGLIPVFIRNDRFTTGLTLISLASLLTMLFLFLLKRRKQSTIQLAAG